MISASNLPRLREHLPYYRRNLSVAFPVMLTQPGAALVGHAFVQKKDERVAPLR